MSCAFLYAAQKKISMINKHVPKQVSSIEKWSIRTGLMLTKINSRITSEEPDPQKVNQKV
jgi:hypothetical protein